MTVSFSNLSFRGVEITGLKDKSELAKKLDAEHVNVNRQFREENSDLNGEYVQPYIVKRNESSNPDSMAVLSHMSADHIKAKYDEYLYKAWSQITQNESGVETKKVSDDELKEKYLSSKKEASDPEVATPEADTPENQDRKL